MYVRFFFLGLTLHYCSSISSHYTEYYNIREGLHRLTQVHDTVKVREQVKTLAPCGVVQGQARPTRH